MSNQNNYYGQVMGGNVAIANNYTMTFRPVLVPGTEPSRPTARTSRTCARLPEPGAALGGDG